MNIGEILLIAAPSLGLGVVIGSALRGSAVAKLRSEVREKSAWIESLTATTRNLNDKLAARDAEHAEHAKRVENLKTDIDARDRQIGRERAEIARLKPLAAKAEAAQRQREAASRAAAEKRRKPSPPAPAPKGKTRAK